MIVLFTDFGLEGPYVGQMKAVLIDAAPDIPVIDLFADAPAFDPMLSAYLLPAFIAEFPVRTVFLCVVDPGVGGARAPVILEADGRRFVGPDNGLFQLITRRADKAAWFEITWRPRDLSASFHGRDLFAPVAARLAKGEWPDVREIAASTIGQDWPDDLARILYVDRFGNAITGLRAGTLAPDAVIETGGKRLKRKITFSDVPPGEAFWYENANGLAEIAVNQGRADTALGLLPGSDIRLKI